MENKQLLGKRIKELRKKKHFNQEQLAELVNLEPTSISNIENGYNYPSIQNLEKIVNVLDTTLSDVFNFSQHQDIKDLLFEINSMLNDNQNKIQDVYKIVKALID